MLIFTAALLAALGHSEYCPSFAPASQKNDYHCAVAPHSGKNPSPDEWERHFTTVAKGPRGWGHRGPLTVDPLSTGCVAHGAPKKIAPQFPCEILKAIAMVESKSTHFCHPTLPKDQISNGADARTMVTFDCGYGALQVTSFMHEGEKAPWDRERVAADPLYNLAVGAKILAEKWNKVACLGDRDPEVIEHWYLALWAYNGFSYLNHPANPHFSPHRGTFKFAKGGEAPYQEKIFGLLENPPKGANWKPIELAYPDLSDIAQIGFKSSAYNGSKGAGIPEPSCASPTDCSEKRSTHKSQCFGARTHVGSASR